MISSSKSKLFPNIKIYFVIIIILCFIFITSIIKVDNTSKNLNFKPKIDYENSLTSLACSIEKYFEINPLHKTLPYIDKLFEEKLPENVILLLCDGLGSRIMKKVLDKNSFLIKNMKSEIYSVFPPTTASCLNSIKTGLNPSEHGWLGFSIYVPPIKKIINLFSDSEKGKKIKDDDFMKLKNEYYYNKKTITDLIKNKGKYLAFDFSRSPSQNIDIVFQRILETLNIKGKKYIFSFIPEPDNILHAKGFSSKKTFDVIKNLNDKIEEYSKIITKYNKTLMIIIADHGHLISKPKKIFNNILSKYLKTNKIFIENRSPAFLINHSYEKEFIKEFKKNFGKDFFLLSKKEILKYNIYGEYSFETKHNFFEESCGDFMAITKDSSNIVLIGEYDHDMASYHGGYSDEEIYIPLIIISS